MEWYHVWTKKLVIIGFFIAIAAIIGIKAKELYNKFKKKTRRYD